MPSIETSIQWYHDKENAGITYSMTDRNGPNSYDCSSAGYYALKAGGFFPPTTPIGNTDSMFNDLERNGWTQIQADANGNFPTQRGDVCIWGVRGASAGAFGHFMMFVDADNVIHCNSYYNGIHTNNYDNLASANGWPAATFYHYTGAPYTPPALPGSPTDQNVDVGSFIKFSNVNTVDDVQEIGGVWQVKTNTLCPEGFTWTDNGIPASTLIEVDSNGFATPDQNLNPGSLYILPGAFQVLDLGNYNGHWMAQIKSAGLKFWVDIATATEVAPDDPGTPAPQSAPIPIVQPTNTPQEVPMAISPDAQTPLPVATPAPDQAVPTPQPIPTPEPVVTPTPVVVPPAPVPAPVVTPEPTKKHLSLDQVVGALNFIGKVLQLPAIKSFIEKLFDKNTTLGRTFRTLLQAFVGISGFIITYVSDPTFAQLLSFSPLAPVVGASAFVSIVTLIHNLLEAAIGYLSE